MPWVPKKLLDAILFRPVLQEPSPIMMAEERVRDNRVYVQINDEWSKRASATGKLLMRLGWFDNPDYAQPLPVNYIHAQAYNSEKYVVFVIQNDQYVTVEDDAALFPSDALVARMKLIGLGNP